MSEKWKDIYGFEGIYKISNYGRVKRLYHGYKIVNRILNPWTDKKTGYQRVDLCWDGTTTRKRIHQLVLENFVGPRGEKMEGRHLDGNKQNNRIDNLKWGTKSENQQDRVVHGTTSRGVGNAKLDSNQVSQIKNLLQSGKNGNLGPRYSHNTIANMFGVTRSAITDINTGKRWAGV